VPLLHDREFKADVRRRVMSLRRDTPRMWGKMSVGQMLWHVNEAMEDALGRVVPAEKVPLPKPIMKFVVLNLPWPKGVQTLKRWVPQNEAYDFDGERERCLRLIDELTAKSLEGDWPESPTLGMMSGKDVSRLHGKHLNHHLTQFGV
jgi:hypothetical protein